MAANDRNVAPGWLRPGGPADVVRPEEKTDVSTPDHRWISALIGLGGLAAATLAHAATTMPNPTSSNTSKDRVLKVVANQTTGGMLELAQGDTGYNVRQFDVAGKITTTSTSTSTG